MTLTAHFRLVRLCEEVTQDGRLEGIDALLGCPVYLFNIEDVTVKFSTLSRQDRELVCDAMLLAINWFREVVNAFSNQDNAEMKQKVLCRLQAIVELTALLEKWLPDMPGYCLPAANFYALGPQPVCSAPSATSQRKVSASRKNSHKKSKAQEEEDRESTTATAHQEPPGSPEESTTASDPIMGDLESNVAAESGAAIKLSDYPQLFRENDVRLITLLNCSLLDSSGPPTKRQPKPSLSTAQLLYILSDLKVKLECIVDPLPRKSALLRWLKKNSFPSLFSLDTASQKRLTIQLNDHAIDLRRHFQDIVSHLQITDDRSLNETTTDTMHEFEVTRSCFIHFLQIFRLLALWKEPPGDGSVSRDSLQRKKFLVQLAQSYKEGSSVAMPLKELSSNAYQYVLTLSTHIPDMGVAVVHIMLLSSLADEAASQALQKQTSEKCHDYLKKQWPSTDNTNAYKANLQYIIRTFLSHADDVLVAMESLTTRGVAPLLEAENGDGNEGSVQYPSLNKQTFSIFYKVMLSEFLVYIKSIHCTTKGLTSQDQEDALVKWSLAVRMFYVFVTCIKGFNARTNLISILKYGRQILEVFLKQAMPLLDTLFRSSKDDVISLLKNIQLSTRSLQHVCSYSKIAKDVALIKQVPPMKKCLETFVYRVKTLLAVNNCIQAFWLGNLKNRDLQGEEILSQASMCAQNDASVCDGANEATERTENDPVDAVDLQETVPESSDCASETEEDD